MKTISLSYNALEQATSGSDDTGMMKMTYDQRNRLQMLTTTYVGRAPFVLSYSYDVGSRVTSVTDDASVQVQTNYDVRSQISGITWQNGTNSLGQL